ncbi:MAG: HlyU family transcriptional regulator [Mesorhizobium sp.]|nr:HlyU family transcriptional regulator [Mesorhizobium sp.]
MSFLKRLFGGGEAAATPAKQIDYNGFTIKATPFQENGQWLTCGVVSKEIDGAVKEHRFIRADRFPSLEGAVEHSFVKGRQLVDQQGERMFD